MSKRMKKQILSTVLTILIMSIILLLAFWIIFRTGQPQPEYVEEYKPVSTAISNVTSNENNESTNPFAMPEDEKNANETVEVYGQNQVYFE